SVKIGIVTFPGSNCDYDCLKAGELVEAESRFIWHRETEIGDVDVVILPGGFAYGDYLRAGAIARFSPIMKDVVRFANEGRPVLGICNGFQVLCEAGLLPGALIRNLSLKYESRHVYIRVENADTIYTNQYEEGDVLKVHIAHGMGNYVASEDVLEELESENRVIFRYVDPDGVETEEWNPNGSAHNIAGIANAAGNVVGLMPHPERAVEAILGSEDGLGLFESLVAAKQQLVSLS
ncbi:MAG TPA: phosphoribosylformylglycinamidine synthase subunit PurQ, partial [Longimicrobiales bacterium]|nr:phosphoribosylformylglycinamidine synthase subunit PurQ [Longimicrobiales bacterium]